MKEIYYSKTGYNLDGLPLFQCNSTGPANSYAYVCNGADGIQQLNYKTANCKGTSAQMRTVKFQDIGMLCNYHIDDGMTFYYPTCVGPSNMN